MTPGMHAAVLLAAVLAPLLAALSVALRPRAAWPRALGAGAALPALLAALLVPAGMDVALPWLVLGTRLGLDTMGSPLLFLTALVWLLSAAYAITYTSADERRGTFLVFFLLTMAGNIGVVLSLDMATFYVSFATMSFGAYVLVIHTRTTEAMRAGRVYLTLVVVGEVLLFAAFTLMATSTGSRVLPVGGAAPVSDVAIALAIAGFGIKAGMIPLHVWLPLAHPVAPTPASAVLSGAMIKAGVIGWFRFLPLGDVARPGWGLLLVSLGLGAAFGGAAIGVTQRAAKSVLAYSSISQMGLITIGMGVALAVPSAAGGAMTAVLIYALHHALAKGALFLGVGVADHTRQVGVASRLVKGGLVLPALALAGAPLTSGAVAKGALKPVGYALDGRWEVALGLLLPLAAVGTTLLMARFLVLAWPRAMAHEAEPERGLWLPWALLVSASLTTHFVWPAWTEVARAALVPATWWGSTWPVLLGAGVALVAGRVLSVRGSAAVGGPTRAAAGESNPWQIAELPRGDLLVLVERGWRRVAGSTVSVCTAFTSSSEGESPGWAQVTVGRAASALAASAANVERMMRRWAMSAALVLVMVLVFVVAMVF